MFNIKKCDFDITVGNQETTKYTKMGDVNLKLKNSTGTTVTVTLSNVRYVPTFIGNLFSIPTAMSNGAEIRFINNKMEVRKKMEQAFRLVNHSLRGSVTIYERTQDIFYS